MKRKRSLLSRFVDVRREEAAPLLALMLLALGKGASAVLFDTAANTQFIKIYGSGSLPLVYLAAAGVSLLVGAGYSAFATKLPAQKILTATLGFGSFSIFLLYAAFAWHLAPWLPLFAMVWKEALFILGNLVLWATAGYLFDLRQGKRLFGLVAAGSILASTIGGLGIPWLVRTLGLSNLFMLAGLAMAAMTGGLTTIIRLFPQSFTDSNETLAQTRTMETSHRQPWWHIFRNRYLGLFLSLSILSNFGFFFADYVYFNRVGSVLHQESELAAFFGHFSAVLGAVQLLTSLFFAGPIITRFGLGLALMALPLINGFGMTLAAIISFRFGLNGAFFWLIIGIKLCDEALRASLLAPAFRILYQPLPAHERLAFQAKTESIIEPLGVGLVGGILVLLTTVWPVKLSLLCLILVVILAIWIGVAELLRHEYTRILTQSLSRARLNRSSLTLEDPAAAAIFLQGTQSNNPGEVIYCLNTLEETGHEDWTKKMAEALFHPDAQVREYCLSRIEEKILKPFIPLARQLWKTDPSPLVRRMAVQTYCALGEEEVIEEISDLLGQADEAWRMGSLLGLLRYGGMEGVLLAGNHLQTMLQSPEEDERKKAAEILGKLGLPHFYRPLLSLLSDPSDQVRRAAIRATGKLKNPRLVQGLLDALSKRSLRPLAILALRQYGPPIIPDLEQYLPNTESLPIRRAIIQVLGQIGDEKAIPILVRQLPLVDKSLRGTILKALGQLRYQPSPESLTPLRHLITQMTSISARNILIQDELSRAKRWPRLTQALFSEWQEDQWQLLKLLSFFPNCQPLGELARELASNSRAQRARAVELLETLIPSELKAVVLLFHQDLSLDQLAERLAESYPRPPQTLEQSLVNLAQAPANQILRWTKACALYEIGQLELPAGQSALEENRSSAEFILQETAAWFHEQKSV